MPTECMDNKGVYRATAGAAAIARRIGNWCSRRAVQRNL